MQPSLGAQEGPDLIPRLKSWQSATDGRGDRRSRPVASNSGKTKKSGRGRQTQRVLLFGRVRELALYRAEVLRQHGFTVIIPNNREESRLAIAHGDFDVAILTYTLPSDTVEELAELLRQHWPGRPIISISDTGWVDRKISPDATVIADEGPAALLAALRRLLRRR